LKEDIPTTGLSPCAECGSEDLKSWCDRSVLVCIIRCKACDFFVSSEYRTEIMPVEEAFLEAKKSAITNWENQTEKFKAVPMKHLIKTTIKIEGVSENPIMMPGGDMKSDPSFFSVSERECLLKPHEFFELISKMPNNMECGVCRKQDEQIHEAMISMDWKGRGELEHPGEEPKENEVCTVESTSKPSSPETNDKDNREITVPFSVKLSDKGTIKTKHGDIEFSAGDKIFVADGDIKVEKPEPSSPAQAKEDHENIRGRKRKVYPFSIGAKGKTHIYYHSTYMCPKEATICLENTHILASLQDLTDNKAYCRDCVKNMERLLLHDDSPSSPKATKKSLVFQTTLVWNGSRFHILYKDKLCCPATIVDGVKTTYTGSFDHFKGAYMKMCGHCLKSLKNALEVEEI